MSGQAQAAVKEKLLVAWSGGKDSALALSEIAALLTTITADYDRVSMHGVRAALLEAQAESLGYPLEKVFISSNASEGEYAARMAQTMEKFRGLGVRGVVFGDVFLADVRKYREDKLAKVGMKAIFPLWGRDTAELARAFVKLGFKAVITCVDSQALDGRFAGRALDEQFLSELPAGVDPCGENGEYHSFVYDGPLFRTAVPYSVGEVVLREERFYFCDLLPAEQ